MKKIFREAARRVAENEGTYSCIVLRDTEGAETIPGSIAAGCYQEVFQTDMVDLQLAIQNAEPHWRGRQHLRVMLLLMAGEVLG